MTLEIKLRSRGLEIVIISIEQYILCCQFIVNYRFIELLQELSIISTLFVQSYLLSLGL